MRSALLRLTLAVLLPASTVVRLSAQEDSASKIIPVQSAGESHPFACKAGTNFEAGHYTISNVTLDDPFKFLYWVEGKSRNVETQLSAKLKSKPFTYDLADHVALGIIEQARFTPDIKNTYSVTLEFVSVQNCNPDAKTLDLVYRVYSTAPPKFLGGAPESQATAETAPQQVTGLSRPGSSLHLAPAGGYNRSYNIFGGGNFEVTPKASCHCGFDTLSLGGLASSSMHDASAAVQGSASFTSWINHADWRVNYGNQSLPAGPIRLGTGALTAQVSATTRPLANDSFQIRFGTLFGGGNMQSANLPVAVLPPQTVLNSAYGSWKSYVGLSSRTNHNVLSVSYGLELGSVNPVSSIDWRKQIGDVADEFWIPLQDHKALEIESRFTFGGIQVPHSIPLAARFFGGNAEQVFIPGDSWQILDDPFIRAIPANRLYLTPEGAGADRFSSINLTLFYPVFSRPIMPKELSTDKEVADLIQGQLNTARSIETNYYSWKDPHIQTAIDQVTTLKQQLDDLERAVKAAQTRTPNQFQGEFSDCITDIETATYDVSQILSKQDIRQYDYLLSLLPADSDDLGAIETACVTELNQKLNDPGVATAVAAVASARKALVDEYNASDQKKAGQKAASDMAFVQRTLHTLFKDFNLFSLGPVAILDRASISPSNGRLGGSRIGPGGGIRLQLASTANFTLGYAWNINERVGEGKGALFFAITVRDLFH